MAMWTSGAEAWNREAVVQALGGDVQLVTELVALFLADCPRLLQDLRGAAARADADAVRRAAHALKGAVANFSAVDAYAAAADVERFARRGDVCGAVDAVETLEREIARLAAAMVAERRCAC